MPESSASTRDSQLRRVRHVLLLLVVILSGAAVAAGQKPRVVKPKSSLAPPSTTQAPTATHELTADDLGTFLEGLVPLQIEREDIAGAEVCNNKVILPLDRPLSRAGATFVLRGNLAPDGCVIKPTAAEPKLLQHIGPINGGQQPACPTLDPTTDLVACAWSPPQRARAGSFGPMKKITNVTNVMMMKSRIAQRIRLIRYRNIASGRLRSDPI